MNFDEFDLQMRMFKTYDTLIEETEKKIDDIIYKYAGVRAIQYDKQRMSFNKFIADETLDRMYEELRKPQEALDEYKKLKSDLQPKVYVDLNRLPQDTQILVMSLMWDNKTYEEIGDKYGYTATGVWKKIRREVEKI